jgi:phosphatidate phosphatase APP1
MLASTLITPRDVLAPAGEPVSLEVEVERRYGPFLDPAIEGVTVEVEGVGTAVTDGRGEAAIPLGPLPPGTRRVKVRVGRREAEAVIAVVPRDQPIFITDIDHTIADVSPIGFIFKRVRNVPAMAGARDALLHISKSMQLVYLTARDHIFTRKTRVWLGLRGFPEAPVYLRRRTRFWSASPRDHKRERLAEIRRHFPDIRWGVGDMPGDVHAYAEHRIPPILLSPVKFPGLPDGTLHVQRWAEILERVEAASRP